MDILKTRKVKTPDRGTPKSAGLDFYIPEDFETTVLLSGESVLISTGIYAKIPEGFFLKIENKSGICFETGLMVGANVIDEDYQGEIKIHLINAGRKLVVIGNEFSGITRKIVSVSKNRSIAQGILIPVSYEGVEVKHELFNVKSERGTGGFGSTDKGVQSCS